MSPHKPPQPEQSSAPASERYAAEERGSDSSARETWEAEWGELPPDLRGDKPSADLDALFASLDERIERESIALPLHSQPTFLRYLGVVGGTLLFVFLIFQLKPRSDWTQYPADRMALVLGLLGVLFGCHVWLMLRPLYRKAWPTWLSHYALPGAALLLPVILSLLPNPLPHVHDHVSTADVLKSALVCVVIGGIFATPFVLLVQRFSRYQSPLKSILWSGVTGGLAANLGLQVFCPKNYFTHLFFGHASVGFLLVLLFALLVRAKAKGTSSL